MTDPLVLFAEYTDIDPQPARDLLASRGIRTELMALDDAGKIDPAQAHAVGIIAGYSAIDASLIDQLPHLGIIAATSNGTNMIDVDAAAARGVWVTNLGTAATEEVATHALLLALGVVRELGEMTRVVANGQWTDELQSVPRRLSELTLGLVGYGRIGAQFARIAAPVFGRVLAYDPFRPPADGIAEPASYAQVLREAHVISLHLPLTSETEQLIDASALASMRDGTVLINVSRGELVDLEACVAALETGKLAGVGFDVLIGEPPAAAHPLRTHPRALLTPHAAYLSDAALRRYQSDPARYIAEWHELGAPTESIVHAP